MISRYAHQGLTWIDLESPTRDEVSVLSEEFELHPIISSELLETSERAKVDLYENAIYLILHFPIRNRTTGHIQETEIDFVLLKNTLITTHYELVDPLHDFARLFEVDSFLSSSKLTEHTGFLFFTQIRELYKHTLFLVEGLTHDIREIEKQIFAGKESEMVMEISKANREIIDIKQALRAHKETLKSFADTCIKIYGQDFSYYINMIEGEYARIEQILSENRDMIHDLRRTNDSLLSVKTNNTLRWLAAINVVLMPIGIIAWIFAMQSRFLYLDEPHQLLTAFGIMIAIPVILIIYFRRKKWL